MEILRERIENNVKITEYSKDGISVSHVIEEPFVQEVPEQNIESPPTIEEQILFETKYQTMLLEMGGM